MKETPFPDDPPEQAERPSIEPPEGSEAIRPEPGNLFESNPIDLPVLNQLENQNILEAGQFTFEQVTELCKLAAVLEKLEIWPYHPLDGKITVTAFFEASTRTRTSFESAILRLDGKVISIADGNTTGQAKGESLADIGEMFNAYADCIIMRHTETDAPEQNPAEPENPADQCRERLRRAPNPGSGRLVCPAEVESRTCFSAETGRSTNEPWDSGYPGIDASGKILSSHGIAFPGSHRESDRYLRDGRSFRGRRHRKSSRG
ncbi:MAG: hypothetical protein P1U85_00170 [Verrucomicrobiales bacterium]|nr:hypothetical protein [Verrucomicrobiales bacterium]